MDELLQAISMVGFPIVAYGGMFWYMIKLNDSHKEEIKALQSSLDLNTQVLSELKEVVKSVRANDN